MYSYLSNEWSSTIIKAWLIVDRDLFFAIAIGDRHFVKRSQDDRDRKIQWSRSFYLYFSNQPFAGQTFQKCQSLKEENFEKSF